MKKAFSLKQQNVSWTEKSAFVACVAMETKSVPEIVVGVDRIGVDVLGQEQVDAKLRVLVRVDTVGAWHEAFK